MATIQLPTEFKEFLRSLNSNDVEYLLVGGFSVGYYGYPRATGDIDVWINTSKENAAKVTRALVEFGFDEANVSPQLFRRKNTVFRMGVPPLQIDILTDVSGVAFKDCYKKRCVAEIDGVQVSIISLKHLRKNKRASGRHKDLDDLENLPEK